MKALALLASILLTVIGTNLSPTRVEPSDALVCGLLTPSELAGGLFEVALTPPELGQGWIQWIRLALDPHANPSTYYPNKEDMPGIPLKSVDPVDPAAPFRKALAQIGAEAVIYLAYSSSIANAGPFESPLYVKILRFTTPKQAEAHWALRQKTGESELIKIAGQEILATKPGKHLRPDLRASMNTLECRSGPYVIRVAPAQPLPDDPGLEWALKQIAKIRKISGPNGAANLSE
jgi:hypothetical protein